MANVIELCLNPLNEKNMDLRRNFEVQHSSIAIKTEKKQVFAVILVNRRQISAPEPGKHCGRLVFMEGCYCLDVI